MPIKSNPRSFPAKARRARKVAENSGIFSDGDGKQKMDQKKWDGTKGLFTQSMKVSPKSPKRTSNGMK